MSEETGPDSENQESVRHAEWVREHPQMDDSGFPEYPDELARRGSSRGAVPNGNPWREVDPEEKPGRPEWEADTLPAHLGTDNGAKRNTAPAANGDSDAEAKAGTDAEPTDGAALAAPPLGASTHQPAVISASNDADERLGHDIGDVLASSKMLEGKHLLVEVVDGEVFLHGTVDDQAVRSEVERLSSSVRGAKQIHNELDVRS